MRERHAAVELTPARAARELPHALDDLRDPRRGERVTARLEPARRIDGQAPVERGVAVERRATRLARRRRVPCPRARSARTARRRRAAPRSRRAPGRIPPSRTPRARPPASRGTPSATCGDARRVCRCPARRRRCVPSVGSAVSTTAAAPSEIGQQCSRRSGSATMRDSITSCERDGLAGSARRDSSSRWRGSSPRPARTRAAPMPLRAERARDEPGERGHGRAVGALVGIDRPADELGHARRRQMRHLLAADHEHAAMQPRRDLREPRVERPPRPTTSPSRRGATALRRSPCESRRARRSCRRRGTPRDSSSRRRWRPASRSPPRRARRARLPP